MQSLRERFTRRILVYHQCEALSVSIKEIIFMDIFFSVGSGVLLEVNSGGGGWNFFFLYWWGGLK